MSMLSLAIYDTSMLSHPLQGVVNVKQKVHPTILPGMDRCITR